MEHARSLGKNMQFSCKRVCCSCNILLQPKPTVDSHTKCACMLKVSHDARCCRLSQTKSSVQLL